MANAVHEKDRDAAYWRGQRDSANDFIAGEHTSLPSHGLHLSPSRSFCSLWHLYVGGPRSRTSSECYPPGERYTPSIHCFQCARLNEQYAMQHTSPSTLPMHHMYGFRLMWHMLAHAAILTSSHNKAYFLSWYILNKRLLLSTLKCTYQDLTRWYIDSSVLGWIG